MRHHQAGQPASSLADLFHAVQMASRSDREIVATIADLFERDLVRFLVAGREVRVRLGRFPAPWMTHA